MGEGIRQAIYCVVAGNPGRVDAESIVVTEVLREALRAIDALAVLAPTLALSLYAAGDRVLTVRAGRWRVTASISNTREAA